MTSGERAELTQLKQSKLTSTRLAQRARIVLLAAKGMQNKDIAAELHVGRVQVARWRERYVHSRLAGIERDLPRGAPPTAVDVAKLVRMTTQSSPASGKAWNARTLAAALGISAASVSRHWRANNLKPQVPRKTEPGQGAPILGEPEDIVGLYLAPPLYALVLCCNNERQAAGPHGIVTAPSKMNGRPAVAGRRNGSRAFARLLAAFKTLDGIGLEHGQSGQRHAEWLTFLQRLDRAIPKEKALYLIAGDAAALAQPDVQKWLARRKRFSIRDAPAPAPWFNAVEGILTDIVQRQSRSTPFPSAPALIAFVEEFVARPDGARRQFIWTLHGGETRHQSAQTSGRSSNRKAVSAYANRTRTMSASAQEAGDADPGNTLRDHVLTLKRDRILQVAAKLFFERGYLQTSVDAIAELLGATKPFVYYHFKSKSDILVEICERSTRSTLAAVENAMAAKGSPRLRLEQFLREFTTVALQEHQLVAIYFREEISLPVEAAERINQMRKSTDRSLSALLSEGIKTGDFQIEDPRIGALVIAGMSSYAFAWYRERGRLDQQEVTDLIVRMALKLVSPSPQQRPAYRIQSVGGA